MPHEYRLQLQNTVNGKAIQGGGWARICTQGAPAAVAVTDLDDTAISTYGVTISNGNLEFRVAETVEAVDIFGMTDTGYPIVARNVKPGDSALFIDPTKLDGTIILPFDVGSDSDISANTEIDTGFELVLGQMIMASGAGAYVTEADAGIGLDVGVDSTSGNDDADGLLDGVSMTTATYVAGTVGYSIGTNTVFVDIAGGSQVFTYGDLLTGPGTKVAIAEGADTNTDEGFYVIENHIAGGATAATVETLTFTLQSGADTAAGYIILPSRVPIISL
jgi:hypothetical protein